MSDQTYKFHIFYSNIEHEVIKEISGNSLPLKIYNIYEEDAKKNDKVAKHLPGPDDKPNSCKIYRSKEDKEQGIYPMEPNFNLILGPQIGQITDEPYIVFTSTSSSG